MEQSEKETTTIPMRSSSQKHILFHHMG